MINYTPPWETVINQKVHHNLFFYFVILVKAVLAIVFSSDYIDQLFIPFVHDFANSLLNGTLENPYSNFLPTQRDAFPYHPLMLYILTVFYIPISIFNESIYLQRFAFFLPNLTADILITFLLLKFSRNRTKAVLLVYFSSPLTLFTVYMHGQLDLLPTSICLLAYYFITVQNFRLSGLVFGLALSMKTHVLVLVPLIFVYLLRREPLSAFLNFFISTSLVFSLVSGPWYLNPAFRSMVIFNDKQSLLFETTFAIGENHIYLAVFAILVLYARFIAYSQYNRSLFILYSTMLLASFVIFVPPAPGWYLWFLPFLTYFYLQNISSKIQIAILGGILNVSYLIFFLTAWESDYVVLKVLNDPLMLFIDNEKYQGTVFTFMQAVLAANLFSIYKYGIKENRVYKKPGGLLIGIGGDSGAGKSTLLKALNELLKPSVTLLEGDGDHRWERGNTNWENVTHLDPKANYLQRQAENLYLLKKGIPVRRSDYDHETGKFTEPYIVKPADYILLSGLHAFYLPKLRKVTDIKIFLDPNENLRLHWKILRDTSKRGYSREKIENQIKQRKKDSELFINPQKSFADIIVEYFPLNEFQIGNSQSEVSLGLKLTISSNYHLEDLIVQLQERGLVESWDYLPDMKRQYILFHRYPSESEIENLVLSLFANQEGIFSLKSKWLVGFDGLVQVVIGLMVQQSVKDGEGGAFGI